MIEAVWSRTVQDSQRFPHVALSKKVESVSKSPAVSVHPFCNSDGPLVVPPGFRQLTLAMGKYPKTIEYLCQSKITGKIAFEIIQRLLIVFRCAWQIIVVHQ